jgi:integrase
MGTRRRETLAVRWQDLDFEEKTATIGRALTEKLEFKYPKNDKVKVLTMPDTLIAVLEKHRAVQKGGSAALSDLRTRTKTSSSPTSTGPRCGRGISEERCAT